MRLRRRRADPWHIAQLEAENKQLDSLIDGADPLEILSRQLEKKALEPYAFKPPILDKPPTRREYERSFVASSMCASASYGWIDEHALADLHERKHERVLLATA